VLAASPSLVGALRFHGVGRCYASGQESPGLLALALLNSGLHTESLREPKNTKVDAGAKSVVEPSGLLSFDADRIGKSRVPDDEKGSPEGWATLFTPSSR
jgi:hypothetical protein